MNLTVKDTHRKSSADRGSEICGGAKRDDGQTVADKRRAQHRPPSVLVGDRNPRHARDELREEAGGARSRSALVTVP